MAMVMCSSGVVFVLVHSSRRLKPRAAEPAPAR